MIYSFWINTDLRNRSQFDPLHWNQVMGMVVEIFLRAKFIFGIYPHPTDSMTRRVTPCVSVSVFWLCLCHFSMCALHTLAKFRCGTALFQICHHFHFPPFVTSCDHVEWIGQSHGSIWKCFQNKPPKTPGLWALSNMAGTSKDVSSSQSQSGLITTKVGLKEYPVGHPLCE